MGTLGLKRWLEGSPARYEAGISCLTLGRGGRLCSAIAQRWVAPGDRMLDLGCGTGILGIECALKGALVTALSQDPSMLARARSYAKVCGLDRAIRYIEGDLLSIDSIFEKEQFDVITANFILSELGSDEREILLRHVESLLSPEGRFIVADEIVPERCLRRALAAGVRWPLLSLAGLVSGHINRPLKGLESSLRGAGWRLRSRRSLLGGTISVLVAELH